jgi:outer membrane lipoprotein-sorting protein
MMKKYVVLILVIVGISGLNLFSETLDEVLAKNYESRGGLEKLKAIKTMTIEGKLIQGGGNLEIPLHLVSKKPNKMRMEVEFQGKKIVQAYDGKTAWWIMPFLGINEPKEMAEREAKETIEQAESLDLLVDYKDLGHQLELVGKEDLEGTDVYKLKLTRKNGKEVLFYLDCETGIQLRSSTYVKREESENLVETIMGDYNEVSGVIVPFQIETKVNGKSEVTMTFSKIKINEKVDDSIFEIPVKK